jgi:hypothetical protein
MREALAQELLGCCAGQDNPARFTGSNPGAAPGQEPVGTRV